jgi:integrase/recombinase XerD
LLFLSTEYYLEGEAVMNTVTVMIRARLNGKYPYLPAVWNGNGRLKPNVALVNGKEQRVKGPYYLRFTLDGRRRFKLVRGDAAVATAAARKAELALKAKAIGIGVVEETKCERIELADAIAEYEGEIKEHKAWSTYRAYSTALKLFVKGCNKIYVDEVSRGCIMSLSAALKKAEFAERTVFNRFGYVYTFLKRYGNAGLVRINDWPKYEDVEYEIYTEEDVQKMLDACETLSERALIKFASDTGFRKGEIAHAEISDINFKEKTIQTRSKSEWKFTTKDHEQRINAVSDSLLETMEQHRLTLDGTLLFPARGGKPNDHLNRIIVSVAKRAGVKVPKKPCHAFRAYYATRLVRSGVDIYTIQRMLGHSDIETTQGYLRAVKRSDPNLRKQINAASF